MIISRSTRVATNGITYVYHIFFIHSSVIICFQALAFVNSAAMPIVVHVPFQIIVYFEYKARNGITGSYDNSFLVFWGTSILFSIVAALIHIPTNSERRWNPSDAKGHAISATGATYQMR